MNKDAASLDRFSELAPGEFVHAAYDAILGRSPTASEREQMLAALMEGDTRTWLLGSLRYGAEGRGRGTDVPGLRLRYAAQRIFRIPVIGPVLEWIGAVVRLPGALRYFRAARQLDIGHAQHDAARIDELQRQLSHHAARIEDLQRHAQQANELRRSDADRIEQLQRQHDELRREIAALAQSLDERMRDITAARAEHAKLVVAVGETRAALDRILPPALGDTLEVPGTPLVALARDRAGVPAHTSIGSLGADARYALFETVFYESPAVAAKQRVYIPYLDQELSRNWPFLDLGCGRGEFLHILRGEGVEAIGVDTNATVLKPLRENGFNVVEQDLVMFLETDRRTYCGVSLLQVAEHLSSERLERVLECVATRIAPGGLLIVETPNPLSPFALGVFHTDPTHTSPLPPERMRYAIEAAGFERTRTLYQARIPADQFAGPDPRAYYADYAIIAWRSST